MTGLAQQDDQGHEPGPALSHDTAVDKALRFGCGALLGGLVLLGLGLLGLGEGLGGSAVAVGALIFLTAAGLAGLGFGEPFLQSLLKLIKWLA